MKLHEAKVCVHCYELVHTDNSECWTCNKSGFVVLPVEVTGQIKLSLAAKKLAIYLDGVRRRTFTKRQSAYTTDDNRPTTGSISTAVSGHALRGDVAEKETEIQPGLTVPLDMNVLE